MYVSVACAYMLNHLVVSDSATPGAVAHQAPLSMGFSRQEYWSEWVAISSCRGSSWPRDQTHISCGSFGRQILYHWVTHHLTYNQVVSKCWT